MNRIYLRGWGAVSPAGWGVRPMLEALQSGAPLPMQPLPGPSNDRSLPVRRVPPPTVRPDWLSHPRLRRASTNSHFAVSAALEAVGSCPAFEADRTSRRLGIVTGTHAASIRFSERFYGEVLKHPPTASPMLFPETVINAPASHLAAFLGHAGRVYSVIGDQTAFVQALRIACGWLLDDRVDDCLVLGLDEAAWTLADALRCFSRQLVLAEGAGALLLSREPGNHATPVALESITDSHGYAGTPTREAAALAMRRQLPAEETKDLLVDAACGVRRMDRPEAAAWVDWSGPRLSPRRCLGEGLCAGTAWQFIAAGAAIASGTVEAANVSVVGGNLEAVGARLIRVVRPSPP